YSEVRIGKYLSDNFPIQNCLKEGYALSPLLFNFAAECAIRKVQENKVELKKLANRSFENVAQFRSLGTTVENQNWIQEEMKRRLNSVNVCYYPVQNIRSPRLLSENVKIRIYKTIILAVVLYGCEICL
ncbi:hypothetical protein B7P43_G03233, partial [Cryptotermes secundus]